MAPLHFLVLLMAAQEVRAFQPSTTSTGRPSTSITPLPPLIRRQTRPLYLSNIHSSAYSIHNVTSFSAFSPRYPLSVPSSRTTSPTRRLAKEDDGNENDNGGADADQSPNSTSAMDNSTSFKQNDTSQRASKSGKSISMGMESGWANLGRYLLPSWSSSSSSSSPAPAPALEQVEVLKENADASEFNPNSRGSDPSVDPIFFRGSTFATSDESSSQAVIDDECEIIDVDACVDEEYTSIDAFYENGTDAILDNQTDEASSFDTRRLLQRALAGIAKLLFRGGKTLLKAGKQQLKDKENHTTTAVMDRLVASGNVTTLEAVPFAENETVITDETNETQSSDFFSAGDEQQQDNEQKQKARSRRRNSKESDIFTALETKDLEKTTLSKQRKWRRRRKRAVALLHAMKNAGLLFFVTFIAGNLMNQFVDLDEDGSFEVHFGKVLSSSSPSTSPPSTLKGEISQRTKFRSVSTPTRRYAINSSRAQAMGLVSRAVARVGPAVVRVETETDLDANGDKLEVTEQLFDSDNGSGDPSKDGEDRGDIFDGVPEVPPPSDDSAGNKIVDFGQGSGIIVNNEGYILTNAHVVDGASRVYVLLTDGRRFKAELCGADDIVDVAVLKIIPEGVGKSKILDLPIAELGDSNQLEVGAFVTAIGSPGGLDNTCTIGIVSGLKRCPKVVGIPDKAGVLEYIQTDAAINQGNSGGPLVDVYTGDVVGINTCIRANMEGTSFAIPINKVMGIVDDLSEGKHITHGYLGVHMSTMNPTLAQYYNKLQQQQNGKKIPEKEGVMIEKVFQKSPAQEGGLKKFDFVTEIGGQRVEKADDAHVIIDRATIGEELSIKVLRDDVELTVQVKPEDLSPRLKQLREDRIRRKRLKSKG